MAPALSAPDVSQYISLLFMSAIPFISCFAAITSKFNFSSYYGRLPLSRVYHMGFEQSIVWAICWKNYSFHTYTAKISSYALEKNGDIVYNKSKYVCVLKGEPHFTRQ